MRRAGICLAAALALILAPPARSADRRTVSIMMTDMQLFGYKETAPGKVARYVRAMSEASGVPVVFSIYPHAEYPDRVRVALAGGRLPDVYNTYGLYDGNFPEAIRSGVAVPLDEYLAKYGRNLRRLIPERVWDAVRVNGKIYAIPEVLLPSLTRRAVFIRGDWLERVGAAPPRTVQEYLRVLRLFRDMDPNRNGRRDEIPYTGRESLGWMDSFFGAYGVLPNGWHETNGRFAPDLLRPEYAAALGTLRGMYREGLLDREFAVNTAAMWEAKIKSGRAGMWEHIGTRLTLWQREVEKGNPGTKVLIIPAPRGPRGYAGTGKYTPYLRVWFVTRAAADPGAVIRFFDWLVGTEGQRLAKYGLRRETYRVDAKGRVVWDPAADPDHSWRSILFALVNDGRMDWAYEVKKDPVNGPRMRQAHTVLAGEGIENPGYDFEVPKTLIDHPELRPPTGSYVLDYNLRVILGKETLDTFPEFLAEWRRRGGDQAMEEATAWYKARFRR